MIGPRNVTPIIRQATTRVRQVSPRKKVGKATGEFSPAPFLFGLGGEHRESGMGQARREVAYVNRV